MTPGPAAEYWEASADRRVEAVPLAHLSVEVGHFYSEDLARGLRFLGEHFRRIARWTAAVGEICSESMPGKRFRMSTCLLIDDYSMALDAPCSLLPAVLEAAGENNLEVDYLARESACAATGFDFGSEGARSEVSIADLAEARLVDDPPPNTTAARPPARQTGWLSNGQPPQPADRTAAMKARSAWKPPRENAAFRHSVYTDVELWSEAAASDRRWSCAMLAAVWQLLRLGLLRYHGQAVAPPQPLPGAFPETWDRLPAVMRVNPTAGSFEAYRTLTICAPRYLPTEHAVRTILDQVAVDPTVLGQVRQRSEEEGILLPHTVVDRIEYLFVETGQVRDAGPG